MNTPTLLQRIVRLGLILMMGASMSACSESWKEEVLLHDGSKLIVERMVDRGGRHEIGQQSPIKEQSLTFTLPATNELVTWKSEFSADVGLADFQPLLLDIFQGAAYVVTTPVGCQSYNKWGRPNPPYVVFKYQDKVWNRITLQELPAEIKAPNIIFGSPDNHVEKLGTKFVTAETVQEINSSLRQPEYKTILREEIENAGGERCSEMIRANDGWEGLGFFKLQASYEACLKYCDRKGVNQQNCPCSKLFKGEK
ncbi:MAG: hypothetical protein PHH47_11695 [Gallionella sp.]|nr:hypothetical protein [Gallionella sp.]MDD4946393.1 hypothetical protein [Gallionella sp.]MDD5613039.1 hypothetical protein [Gallionella sp.]